MQPRSRVSITINVRHGAVHFTAKLALIKPDMDQNSAFFDDYDILSGKGPFIIYGREGAGDFGERATFFWQVADGGGHLFLVRKKFEKACETYFSTRFGQK